MLYRGEEMNYPDSRFKTLRHIETVRNFLNACIVELLHRAEQHDQSKLQAPEKDGYDELTEKLRGSTYGSPEYKEFLERLKPVLAHHYANNRHHPEHFENGILDMTLIDLLEMLVDWKSSGLRHDDGDIFKSIEINKPRFNISEDLNRILTNTAVWLNTKEVFHKANES
jgi:hypothetical protein